MLRIVRRHQDGCPLTSETDHNCPSKVKCPVHLKGVGPDGRKVRKSLNTRNWAVASQMLLEAEIGVKQEAPLVTVQEAIRSYVEFKAKRSDDTRRKIKLVTGRLKAFLDTRQVSNIADVT